MQSDKLNNLNTNLDRLTISKATDICDRNNYEITGFVMRNNDGRACIVEKSAVRWIENEAWWDIMHPAHKTEIETMRLLLEAANCPNCDGSGAYYDNYGNPEQCQWCYERNELLKNNDEK